MAASCPEISFASLVSRRDPTLIAILTSAAVGAYVLGVLSYYAFTRWLTKATNRRSLTRQIHTDHPGKASSYGIDGSFTPIRATFPSRSSFTNLYDPTVEGHTSIASHSSEVRGDKVSLHSDIEPRPHPQAGRDILKPLSSPYRSPANANFALNGAPQVPESAVPSQSLVNAALVSPSPAIPRRPSTMEDLKPLPLVKTSTTTPEQPLPTNHVRSCSVPGPLSPVVRRPPSSSVAWHLPSRSRSMTKLRESYRDERSDSEHSLYGIPTPPPTATADGDGRNRPVVLDAKMFEGSRALASRSSGYIDPLLIPVRLTPSPTPESIMQLYGSFPAPPESNTRKGSTAETPPRTAGNAPMVGAQTPLAAYPTAVPAAWERPVLPLALRPRRSGSVSIPPPQHHALPSRPHTAGACSVSTARPSSASGQKRIHKSPSAGGSLVSLSENSFLVPPRTPPTPRLATSTSLSSLRPKTPPRPVPSRNAVYMSPGSTKPQPEGAVVNRL